MFVFDGNCWLSRVFVLKLVIVLKMSLFVFLLSRKIDEVLVLKIVCVILVIDWSSEWNVFLDLMMFVVTVVFRFLFIFYFLCWLKSGRVCSLVGMVLVLDVC